MLNFRQEVPAPDRGLLKTLGNFEWKNSRMEKHQTLLMVAPGLREAAKNTSVARDPYREARDFTATEGSPMLEIRNRRGPRGPLVLQTLAESRSYNSEASKKPSSWRIRVGWRILRSAFASI